MKGVLCAVICVCVWLGLDAARPKWHELSSSYTFENYKSDFGKVYRSKQENSLRQEIFAENMAKILRHNANPSANYRMGVNHMTDWTPEERKSVLGYHKGLAHRQVTERTQKYASGLIKQTPFDPAKAPISVDWRNKNILTAVKDQGNFQMS